MNSDYAHKIIALAGMHQALIQVQQIAWRANYDYAQMDVSLKSLFVRNPDSYLDVYGSIDNIRHGLNALKASFTEKSDKAALERARYMVSLMVLSKNIQKNNKLGELIGTTLSLLDEASHHLEEQRDNVINRLAQLYQNTISPLTPRISVYGDPEVLKVDNHAASIRALLLAGIRASMLWYQAGGGQLNLLLGKSKYLTTIDQMLD